MPIASINPATGDTFKTFTPLSENEIEQKLAHAAEAFQSYKRTSFTDRTAILHRAGDILENEKKLFGEIMTREMGKPLWSAAEEALKCALVCRYYADNAEKFLADEIIETNATKSYVRYEPLGIVLAVMPWNFPFWQVFRFAAPALMAGNAGILKHSSNVPQCALAIEDIFRRAGLPEGVFQSFLIEANQVEPIIRDPRVKAVTLTGSEPAGSMVASIAGKMIKKSVLELGGSDPFIVMPTANIDDATRAAVRARTINNGQSCIAAKRFIVHQSVFETFTKLFIERMSTLKVTDPMLDDCDIGPLATPAILEELDAQVQQSVAMGAHVLVGGKRLDRVGNYYAPTIITDIPQSAPAYTEELFGPVASLFRVKNIDEAINLANETRFGLGASVWTTEREEQSRFIEELESGSVFVNGMVASDPRLPFGGVKNSGFGRELSVHGIREFVNIKTIWMK
jgi:succinate-semialdehyde dehydrogenase / glutarate-semialdehyde dehydrogenase